MGYHDTFLMLSIKRCPDGPSLSNLCNTGISVPFTVEHFGPIMFHVERHQTEGEGNDRHVVMVGWFPFFRIKPFWKRWFALRYVNCCEEVHVNAYIDCYPERDGAKGIMQLNIPVDLDLDELLVSPRSE